MADRRRGHPCRQPLGVGAIEVLGRELRDLGRPEGRFPAAHLVALTPHRRGRALGFDEGQPGVDELRQRLVRAHRDLAGLDFGHEPRQLPFGEAGSAADGTPYLAGVAGRRVVAREGRRRQTPGRASVLVPRATVRSLPETPAGLVFPFVSRRNSRNEDGSGK